MTISAIASRVLFSCDGTTTVFPVPIQSYQATDFTVILTASAAAGGAQLTLGLNSDYTLTATGTLAPPQWTMTTASAYPAGFTLQIFCDPVEDQQTQYVQGQAFPSLAVQTNFDRLTQMVQRLDERITRAPYIPDGDVSPQMALPAASARANSGLVFDANGNASVGVLTSTPLSQTLFNSFLTNSPPFAVTAAELAAGVTPANQSYPPGDPRRYGAILNGSTDDTAALNVWASVGGALNFPAGMTAQISGAVTFISNSQVRGGRGSLIRTATPDISLFYATGQTAITFTGLTFQQTVAGGGSGVGGILLNLCTYCTVEGCEFIGMQFKGVFILASNNCTVRNNYCHNAGASTNSTADISIESSPTVPASYNIIDGNQCFGGAEFGISCWDPYSGVLPLKNIICNNRVGGGQSGYGILVYMPDAGDSFTQVIGNFVENVQGSIATNVSSGAGIYGVGAGLGGLQVIGNTVRNCCINTANATLAPAGIGISGTSAGAVPVVISDNTIEGMTQYHGILMTGVLSGGSVIGNQIRHPAANSTGHGIAITNSNNISVNDNSVTLLTTTNTISGICLSALGGATNSSVTIMGNTVFGGHGPQIRTLQTGGGINSGLTIVGNTVTGGDTNAVCLQFDSASANNAMVSSNVLRANGTPGAGGAAIVMTSCVNMRYAENFVNTGGVVFINFSGTNTGGIFTKGNAGSGSGAGVVNAGTGLIVERYASAAPVAGTWAVGDLIDQAVPVVGNPKRWRCTVAGSPGTFVSEGNL